VTVDVGGLDGHAARLLFRFLAGSDATQLNGSIAVSNVFFGEPTPASDTTSGSIAGGSSSGTTGVPSTAGSPSTLAGGGSFAGRSLTNSSAGTSFTSTGESVSEQAGAPAANENFVLVSTTQLSESASTGTESIQGVGFPGSSGASTTNPTGENNVNPSGVPTVSSPSSGEVKGGGDSGILGGSHSRYDDTNPDAAENDLFWPWIKPSNPSGAGKAAPGSGEESKSSNTPSGVAHESGSLDMNLFARDSRRIDAFFASFPDRGPDVPDCEQSADQLDAVFTRRDETQPALAGELIDERGTAAALVLLASFGYAAVAAQSEDERRRVPR
jgi:hypothetical protein